MSRTLTPKAEALRLLPSVVTDCEDGCAAAETVRAWHDDVHGGAFSVCCEQPCDAIRRL